MKPIMIRPPYFVLLTPVGFIVLLLYWMKNINPLIRIGLAILLILTTLFFGWKSIKLDNKEVSIRRFLGIFSKTIPLSDISKVYIGKGINPSLPYTLKLFYENNGVENYESFNFESRKENLVSFLSQVLKEGIEVEASKNNLCNSIYKKALERVND